MNISKLFSTARQIIENEKESLFTNFQKNNRPSGLEYIKNNCVDYLFEAIKDDVIAASESAKIIIKHINAEVIDYTDENSVKIASIRYNGVMSVDGEIEEIYEVWHFKYDGWNWKLAGIEQVKE